MKSDRPSRSPSRKVALFIDHEGLRAAHPERDPDTAGLAAGLFSFASSLGRVAIRMAYADWTDLADDAQQYHRRGIEARLVLPHEHDDDRGDLVLALDALEAALTTGGPETFVIASADGGLREIVVRLRRMGREVIVAGPREATSDELKACADRFVPLGSLNEARGPARTAVSAPVAPRAEVDFKTYDWTRLLRLLNELEKRLDFVGLKYLNHKVLNRENCGFDDRSQRQALINHAIDEGILVVYQIDNIEAGGDPVSACRLGREHEIVKRHLGNAAAKQEAEVVAPPGDESAT